MLSRPSDVVISGLGCIGPLGSDLPTIWRRLQAGESGVRRLAASDLHELPLVGLAGLPQVGAPATASAGSSIREPLLGLIDAAVNEAVANAVLTAGSFDPLRAGCVLGSSKGGLVAFAKAFRSRSAGLWSQFPVHVASSKTAARLGLGGPCLAPVAACATGLVSVLRGADLIRQGECDVVVAGSGDASLHPAVLASFRRMGVLSRRTDSSACRPFSADRDGFVVGEGAAAFVLERREHALARGVRPLATVLGGAMLSDPSGMTAVDPTGQTLARAIQETLRRSERSAGDVGHVNLHGTATRSNDISEAAGLRVALGPRVDEISCVALKGAIGHQLGAAGAAELAATVLAIRDGLLPPTANFGEPDPLCALPVSASRQSVHGCGLKLSLGFGGHVVVACLGPT